MLLNKLLSAVKDKFRDDSESPGIDISIDKDGEYRLSVYRSELALYTTRATVLVVVNADLDEGLIQLAKDFLAYFTNPPHSDTIRELSSFVWENCSTTNDPW